MKSTLAISAIIFTVGIVTLPVVFSDNSFESREGESHNSDVASISHPLYKEECGSCHMAYPPALLSTASWAAILNGLDDHFGDNAELDAQTHQTISDFLTGNSADNSNYRRSRKFMQGIDANSPPLRISETAYFKRKHEEIPAKMVSGNSKVSSFSQCNSCHQDAQKGVFDDDNVRIPGYGRWDD
ncbi:MAG TPA: diheme cytochrome c [Gammaproteobacteria bacterium]